MTHTSWGCHPGWNWCGALLIFFFRLSHTSGCSAWDCVQGVWSIDSGHEQEWGQLAENGAIQPCQRGTVVYKGVKGGGEVCMNLQPWIHLKCTQGENNVNIVYTCTWGTCMLEEKPLFFLLNSSYISSDPVNRTEDSENRLQPGVIDRLW